MYEPERRLRFEQLVVPHLDAAYSLARGLTHNDQDAQDMVQESCLRAYRFFSEFRGENIRAWLLTIVRNTCYTWLNQQHRDEVLDESLDYLEGSALNPETAYLHLLEQQEIAAAIKALPLPLREVAILRELEELSYKEISSIARIPLGTVMSRLAHARKRLQRELTRQSSGQADRLTGCQ